MTGIERVKDVEQRLELPAQYQEAVEKHVPVMPAWRSGGSPLTKTGASASSPTPSPW